MNGKIHKNNHFAKLVQNKFKFGLLSPFKYGWCLAVGEGGGWGGSDKRRPSCVRARYFITHPV